MDKKILYKFFEGEANTDEKQSVKEWLEENPENEDILFREREFFNAVILSGDHRNTEYLTYKKPLHRYPVIKEILKIAAVIAIVAGLGIYFHTTKMNEIQLANNVIKVPPGQRVNITLPDGTNVWLNAGSEIKYPAYFTDTKREVELDGEAYFNVLHDKDKAFIVRTHKCDIEVLGTIFNVECYSGSQEFSAALMEGSVKITNKDNPSNTLVLSLNHEAKLLDGVLKESPITDFEYYRWQEGLICFKDINFSLLMQRFEKCYDVDIIIENKQIAGQVFSGKFRFSDGIDNALRILQKDAGYTYEKNNDGTVIYIR